MKKDNPHITKFVQKLLIRLFTTDPAPLLTDDEFWKAGFVYFCIFVYFKSSRIEHYVSEGADNRAAVRF